MKRVVLFAAVAASLGVTPVVGSQARAQDAAQCDKAARVIAKGHPAKKDDWAFLTLSGCGVTGAEAFAAGIRHYRRETDIAALENFMGGVDNWRDASIFAAVLRLATDSTATSEARAFAVRHLILLLQRYFVFTYAGLTRKADTTVTAEGTTWQELGCVAQMSSEGHGSLIGSALPVDYEGRIRATFTSLANTRSVPAPVRYASLCALSLTAR